MNRVFCQLSHLFPVDLVVYGDEAANSQYIRASKHGKKPVCLKRASLDRIKCCMNIEC